MRTTSSQQRPRRIVVKVGTSMLATPSGLLDRERMSGLVGDLAGLVAAGHQVILVSSGAIAAGMDCLGLNRRPTNLPQLQAAASIGQSRLMRLYDECFSAHGRVSAQVLLTQADLADRRRYLNARNTFFELLREGVVPVVNENDAVSVEEIKVGDNDRLSALVASLVRADLLVILSNVDGLLQDGRVIPELHQVTEQLERLCTGPGHRGSLGGMATKLQAARMALHAGFPLIIANGLIPGIVGRIVAGDAVGTRFQPAAAASTRTGRLASRKQWLAFGTRKARGTLVVDAGAVEALVRHGRSLLATGIVKVTGDFSAGDIVGLLDVRHREFARGLSNFSAKELAQIRGHKSSEFGAMLGYKSYEEVIHRNNLVLLAPHD